MIAIVTCYVLILTEPRFEERLDVVYREVSSSQSDASLFVPSIQDLRGYEARIANVSGQVLHLDANFDFPFLVGKESLDEVFQSLFRTPELLWKECLCPLLGDGREGVEQVESEHFALHQMTVEQALPNAQHFDVRLCPICVFVGRLKSEESIHFDDGWSLKRGTNRI